MSYNDTRQKRLLNIIKSCLLIIILLTLTTSSLFLVKFAVNYYKASEIIEVKLNVQFEKQKIENIKELRKFAQDLSNAVSKIENARIIIIAENTKIKDAESVAGAIGGAIGAIGAIGTGIYDIVPTIAFLSSGSKEAIAINQTSSLILEQANQLENLLKDLSNQVKEINKSDEENSSSPSNLSTKVQQLGQAAENLLKSIEAERKLKELSTEIKDIKDNVEKLIKLLAEIELETGNLEKQLQNRHPGFIIFKFYREMIAGKSQNFSVLISDQEKPFNFIKSTSQNYQENPNTYNIRGEQIQVSQFMSVSLKGDEKFKISSLSSSILQPVIKSEPTNWDWRVLPLESGLHPLFVTVSLSIRIPGDNKELVKNYEPYRQDIKVKIDPIYSVGTFVEKYGLILMIVVASLVIVVTLAVVLAKKSPINYHLPRAKFGGSLVNTNILQVKQIGSDIHNNDNQERPN